MARGDLNIYYTYDKEGNSTIPRVVITTQGDRVTEVRGIEWEENVDDYIKKTNMIGDKLKEVPGGEGFFETDADMKRLTSIDRKITAGEKLDREELIFLYETEEPIKYFGYKKDPRIAELRSQRNPEEDMMVIFECTKDQIAHVPSEINKNTKAYVGPLEKSIFDLLARYNIEQIYTSFPEGKIRRQTVEIGGKTAQQLKQEFTQAGVNISMYAEDMIESRDFTTLPNPQIIKIVRLKLADLGLTGTPTTDQVYARAAELGLDLCPPELGVYQRLEDTDQPMNEWYWIAMKQIAGRHGHPSVFLLGRHEDGVWLSVSWADPDGQWNPDDAFVFSLRKQDTQSLGLLDRIFKR